MQCMADLKVASSRGCKARSAAMPYEAIPGIVLHVGCFCAAACSHNMLTHFTLLIPSFWTRHFPWISIGVKTLICWPVEYTPPLHGPNSGWKQNGWRPSLCSHPGFTRRRPVRTQQIGFHFLHCWLWRRDRSCPRVIPFVITFVCFCVLEIVKNTERHCVGNAHFLPGISRHHRGGASPHPPSWGTVFFFCFFLSLVLRFVCPLAWGFLLLCSAFLLFLFLCFSSFLLFSFSAFLFFSLLWYRCALPPMLLLLHLSA